jgi:hypothetical protein
VLQAYRQQETEGAYQFSDDRTKAETISVVKNILA